MISFLKWNYKAHLLILKHPKLLYLLLLLILVIMTPITLSRQRKVYWKAPPMREWELFIKTSILFLHSGSQGIYLDNSSILNFGPRLWRVQANISLDYSNVRASMQDGYIQECTSFETFDVVEWQIIVIMIIIISYLCSAFSECNSPLDNCAVIMYNQVAMKACSKNFAVPSNNNVLTFCLNFWILSSSLISRGSAFHNI